MLFNASKIFSYTVEVDYLCGTDYSSDCDPRGYCYYYSSCGFNAIVIIIVTANFVYFLIIFFLKIFVTSSNYSAMIILNFALYVLPRDVTFFHANSPFYMLLVYSPLFSILFPFLFPFSLLHTPILQIRCVLGIVCGSVLTVTAIVIVVVVLTQLGII